MNGAGGVAYTFSPRQMEALLNEVHGIYSKTKASIEADTENLLLSIGKNWADKKACEWGDLIASRMSGLISDLASNFNQLSHSIIDKANEYARIGGKPPIPYYPNISFSTSISSKGKIKDHFDTPDMYGDTSGFINNIQGGKNLLADFEKVSKSLIQAGEDIQSAIRRLNAFGNEGIKVAMARIANDFISYANNCFREIKKRAENDILDVLNRYGKVSQKINETVKQFNRSLEEG